MSAVGNPVAVVREHRWLPKGATEPVAYERVVNTFCPGCKAAHPFTVEVYDVEKMRRANGDPRPTWDWDGNLEAPTFSPSLLCYSSVHICRDDHTVEVCEDHENCDERIHKILNEDFRVVPSEEWSYGHESPHPLEQPWGNCHSFLRSGRWEFLSDSAHALAGQTVDMVPLPDWLAMEA